MLEVVSIIIACLALLVSGYTAWRTFLQRGKLVMTQPNMIYFGHDGPDGPPKIILFTTLFSTAFQGNIAEHMFIELHAGGSDYTLARWGFADAEKLRAASGMYISQLGISGVHHFVLGKFMGFRYSPGPYTFEVFASIVNRPNTVLLKRISLHLDNKEANVLDSRNGGVLFSWNPNNHAYTSEIVDSLPFQLRTPTI